MKLVDAFQVRGPFQAALVGAGGKTTTLFRLARQLPGPVILTTTTHFGFEQVSLADRHIVIQSSTELEGVFSELPTKVVLISGPATNDGRVSGLDFEAATWLHEFCGKHDIHFLIEADGSRRLPLKAPAAHEPAIPSWCEHVIVLAGLSGLNQPIGPEFVHRPERFATIAGVSLGTTVTEGILTTVLTDPMGGLKNIPSKAKRTVLLNQADTDELQAQAGRISLNILSEFRIAAISSMNRPGDEVIACYKPVAGIILAAGGSTRFGQSKPMLDWKGKPFVHQIARTALEAGLDPVIVITGFAAEAVQSAVTDLKVRTLFNPDWLSGQASTVKAAIHSLPDETGAAIFLLADQPQIDVSLLKAELELYRRDLSPVIAPMIDGRRANPVLFDRAAFEALKMITGDSGGRQVFSQFSVSWLEWNDRRLLLDVDTPEDYERLLRIQ